MANTNQKDPKILLAWQTEGFSSRSFNSTSIALVFVVIFGAMIWAVYTREWLSLLVFFMLPVALYSYMVSDKKMVNIGIMDSGVMVSGRFYSFDIFSGWWADDKTNTLYLVPKKKLSSQMAIPMGAKSAAEISRLFPVGVVQITGGRADLPDIISGWLRK